MTLKVEFNGSLSDLLAFVKRAKLDDISRIECIIDVAEPLPKPGPALTPEAKAHAAVIPYVGTSKKIYAIKQIREATGWGLEDSKTWIERHYPQIRFST